MKSLQLFLFALLSSPLAYSQTEEPWIRFFDTKTEKIGYKDLKGNIKIPARFENPTRADTFYNIIAVMKLIAGKYQPSYFLKSGRSVAQDSVYMFDATFDCESEGKIIFYDKTKDCVGFLDKNGFPIIPAAYNWVSPFRNGIAVGYRNAIRKCADENTPAIDCEHWSWHGGESVLINEKNEVLVDSVALDYRNINWYSLKLNDPSPDTSIYITLKGRNNTTYSFMDYEKEFNKWFSGIFLSALSVNRNRLNNFLFDEITFSSEDKGWRSLRKDLFLKTYPAALTAKRFELNNLKEISIGQRSLNELIYDKAIYKKYMNACGEHNGDKFPLFNVTLTHYKKRIKPLTDSDLEFLKEYEINYQEQFDFLRTEKGYELLGVSLEK